MDFSRTVITEVAPPDRIPQLIAMPTRWHVGGPHPVRFEPWRADGRVFVLVRADGDAQDLAVHSDQIAERARKWWGADAQIIEDWAGEAPRYREVAKDGERVPVDVEALEERGFVLVDEPSGALIR